MMPVFLTFFTVTLFIIPSSGNRPVFDNDVWIQILFLPHDTPVGTVIYRLRAVDNQPEPDYPLTFSVERTRNNVIDIVPLNDTEADMVLRRPLQKGQIYQLILHVTDTANQKNTVEMKLNATDASANPSLVFTSFPRQTLTVREDARIGQIIGSVTARKNAESTRYPHIFITGSNKFDLRTVFENANEVIGHIVLKETLDFEQESFYLLNVSALGGYTDKFLDNRNIIVITIPVKVEDVPDSNPVFGEIPLINRIKADAAEGTPLLKVSTTQGTNIIYKIKGDKSEYFKIDPRSGQITVARPLQELTKGYRAAPVIIQVTAEIQGASQRVTTKEVMALVEQPTIVSAPVFSAPSYTSSIDEHSPVFTLLGFQAPIQVTHQAECIALEVMLQNSRESSVSAMDVFDVKPTVVVHKGNIEIYVKNSSLLDYEHFTEIQFQVIVYEKESPSSRRGTATITVTVNDVNDNAPQFTTAEYVVNISENIVEGTAIAQVSATDVDTGDAGNIRYTKLEGEEELIRNLRLNEETGVISLDGDFKFDRETKDQHIIIVEARDNDGSGNANTTRVIINVKDLNDNPPQFPRMGNFYQVCLPADLRRGEPFFNIWATDRDEPESPNSRITYSLNGNQNALFRIDSNGYITLTEDRSRIADKTVLLVNATDSGSPQLYSTATLQIFTNSLSCKSRPMEYLVDNPKEELERNKEKMESFLMNLNGGSFTRIDSFETMNDLPTNASYPRTKIKARVTQHENESFLDLTVFKRHSSDELPLPLTEPVTSNCGGEQEISSAWKWVLIALLILLALALLILLCCCICRPNSKSNSKHQHHHRHRHRDKRISSAPANGRGIVNGRVPTNVQYSRHMQDDWIRNKDDDDLIDPVTGKHYTVRHENGRKILVRHDDEKQNRKVTRGTNVTESTLQTEALMTDANGTILLLEDDVKTSRLKNQFLEKKSLFTIAYDGMHSKHDLLKDTDDTSPPTVS